MNQEYAIPICVDMGYILTMFIALIIGFYALKKGKLKALIPISIGITFGIFLHLIFFFLIGDYFVICGRFMFEGFIFSGSIGAIAGEIHSITGNLEGIVISVCFIIGYVIIGFFPIGGSFNIILAGFGLFILFIIIKFFIEIIVEGNKVQRKKKNDQYSGW